jgi:hypothetical protein
MEQSPRFRLNKEDLRKISVGAFVAAVGAVVTFFLELAPRVDFGPYTPIAVAAFGVLANVVRKFLAGLPA